MLFVLRICVQRCRLTSHSFCFGLQLCRTSAVFYQLFTNFSDSISKLLFLCALTLLSTQTSQSFCWFKTFVHRAAQISYHHHFDFVSTLPILSINIITIFISSSSSWSSTSSSFWSYAIQHAASFNIFSYHDGFQWLAQADLAPDDHERIKIVSFSEKVPSSG